MAIWREGIDAVTERSRLRCSILVFRERQCVPLMVMRGTVHSPTESSKRAMATIVSYDCATGMAVGREE